MGRCALSTGRVTLQSTQHSQVKLRERINKIHRTYFECLDLVIPDRFLPVDIHLRVLVIVSSLFPHLPLPPYSPGSFFLVILQL